MNKQLHFDTSDSEELLERSSKTKKSKFLCFSKEFKEELKTNIKIAFPVMITNIFQFSLNIETTSFCGRLSPTELEGVALALSLISALGWCFCSGMVSACDTMFAQSFGSEHKKRTGLFLQRGLLLMNLVPVCLWALHINFEPLLILFGQDPEISKVTGTFVIMFTPGLTFIMNYLLLARYMQDQGCLWPPVVAGICGNIFNICSQLLFVTYLQWGIKAAALCHATSFGVMFLIELIYVLKSKFYLATWPGLQLEALYDWLDMFRLGLAGVGHITFEVIIWEASVFMGGILGNVQLAVQSIMMQLVSFMFLVYFGAGIACNIRVGQCLGANKPELAKLAYRSGVLVTALMVTVVASLFIALRYQIPYVFTDKLDIVDMVTETMPFMYLIVFVDPFSGVTSASFRGCGRQFSGCIIMFIAFYLLSLPTSIVLAFVYKYNIKGIWLGNSLGSCVSVASCFLVLECQDWSRQANLAQKRIACNTARSDNDEETHLLPPYSMDIEEVKRLPSHIRTPSHPVMCSIDVVKLPPPRTEMDKSIIYKRILISICALIFFLCGLLIHIFLPEDAYLPYRNNTIAP